MKHKCPYCNSEKTISYGDFIKSNKKIIKHRKCLRCGGCFEEKNNE